MRLHGGGSTARIATEAEVLAFEAARHEDGTGSKVKFWNKPRATVPPEQLALEAAIAHAVGEDGNQTRVQLAGVEEGIHARVDDMEKKLGKVLDYHEKAPPKSQEGDLELMARVQKLQLRAAAASGSTTFHVGHAAIRTSLERGGLTAAQLLSLHKAANLNPPMRVNAAGASVPEKAKYQLAQSLCSAAGSGQHNVQSSAERLGDAGSSGRSERQVLDYATLGAWMEALRHQRPIAEWEPPVHAALLEPPPTKRRRNAAAAQPAAVEAAAASGSAADMLSANAGSPKLPARAPRSNGGASNLVIELHSATCSTTSGATSPTTVATNSAAASPTATAESHRVTSAVETALLRASRAAETPRPHKESSIDTRL